MKKSKGFTLAELLIVVAIIAVLVAIAIPVFASQLEKSREATDMANIRAAYAEVVTKFLADNDTSASAAVTAQQKVDGWETDTNHDLYTRVDGTERKVTVSNWASGNNFNVSIDASGIVHVDLT